MSRWNFSHQNAIVTGGGRGIGRAITLALAEAGATVFVFDLGDVEPGPFTFLPVDITDSAAVGAAVASLPTELTLLVNNAGITRDRSLLKMTDEEWTAVLDVNLRGAFHMIRAVGARMRDAGRGHIVNITSINGLRGKFGQGNYAASKAGLIGLTKTAARELGPKGITVNAVAPGMVMTDMARRLPAEVVRKAVDETVLNRLPEPGDIANAVLFLLSEEASFITGVVLRVDAGQYI